MKKLFSFSVIAVLAFLSVGCEDVPQESKSPVVLYEGSVELADKKFGMYYGDRFNNEIGVYSIVLSDAVCIRNGLGEPYLDSEGDMLVIEFNGKVSENDSYPRIPDGKYVVGAPQRGQNTVNPANSYVRRYQGQVQSKYRIESGSFEVSTSRDGGYSLVTNDLVISRGSEKFSVRYSYEGSLLMDDYKMMAPAQLDLKQDLIDVPFFNAEGGYYGNLFGYGTGNYLVTLSTKGFSEDESNTLPGVMLCFNFFAEIPKGDNKVIAVPPGTYTVQTYVSGDAGTMLYGFDMASATGGSSSPFGTFMYQIVTGGAQSTEYIHSGTVKVGRDEDEDSDGIFKYSFEYDLKSSSTGRSYKGYWTGEVPIEDFSTDSDRLVLSTLEKDVECDMSKVEKGTIEKVETLVSTLNTTESPRFDLKDVWQVVLEPRDWTAEEKKEYDWDERLEHWTPDGDCMVLEFVLPLGSTGDIAPKPNYDYVYHVQPNCSIESPDYTMCVDRMGRPYDDLFHPVTAARYGWTTEYSSWFPTEFDYCNSRRGFTWDGWFRGVWYYHMKKGSYFIMDENAPAVFGTITVSRTGNIYTIIWDLLDDAESPNKITGSWKGELKRIINADFK